jgi:hypothetical protein
MEEFNFNDILSEDEISSLFDDDSNEELQESHPEQKENKKDDTTEVDVDDIFKDEDNSESPESVGSEEDDTENEDTSSEKKGTSPTNFYSSIAKALKEDSILSYSDDKDFNEVKSAEDFYAVIEKEINSRLDEKQKRIDEALNYGVEPTVVSQYEKALDYLDSLSDDILSDESDKGETLRKQLIYQDFINRGYSKERAQREVQKSFNAGSDIEDAKESLQSNKDYFKSAYESILKEAKDAENERIENEKKEAESLKKSILEDDKFFGELIVDKSQRKKIYESITKPYYKDPKTGEWYTEVQKFEKDNHTEFMKYVGLMYTLTNGFSNLDGLVKNKLNKEMKKGLKNLENTLNNSTRGADGSLSFVTSRHSDDDASYIGKGGWALDF